MRGIMLRTLCAGLALLFMFYTPGPGAVASEKAERLREKNELVIYSPPREFLSGNFVADEVEPRVIFASVSTFAGSRPCKTTWLVEKAEKTRIESDANQQEAFESTLYLEQDCSEKVTHFIFVDRSRSGADQWLKWRKKFHGSKAEGLYGSVGTALVDAAEKGFPVRSELRFIQIDGDLQLGRPEDYLKTVNFQPVYDLEHGRAIGR